MHSQGAQDCFNAHSNPGQERRIGQRWTQKASLSLSSLNFGFALDAVAINHGLGGICLQTRCRLRPKSNVCLRTRTCEPPASHIECSQGPPTIAMAEIRWCEKIADPDGTSYYLSGLKYFPPEY